MISDDSGLSIKSMKNKPGIYSARLAKQKGNFFKAMKYNLKKMKNKKNRNATFFCSLSIKFPKKKIITGVGKVDGNISEEIIGKKGFGYDPIFIPNNEKKTFGQISKKRKIKIDHRYSAFKKLKKKIKTL